MNKIRFVLSTPDGIVLDCDVVSVSVRGSEGDLAVLAGHVPLVTSVKAGKCTVLYDENEAEYEISRGMISVSGDKAILMTDSAVATKTESI